jgi:hypothetical protein
MTPQKREVNLQFYHWPASPWSQILSHGETVPRE